jgi:predicted nucleic acid-binding protein
VFLLDTNVVSELRKVTSGRADPAVVAWERRVLASELFLSAITVFEIEVGILRLERRDPLQARIFRLWFGEHLLAAFAGRILALDETVALRGAELQVPDKRPERDAFIAATALVHGMTVVTRNVGDFAGTGLKLINPWE